MAHKDMNRDSPQRNQLNDEVGSFITRRIKIDNFRSDSMCGIHERAHTSFRNRQRLIVIRNLGLEQNGFNDLHSLFALFQRRTATGTQVLSGSISEGWLERGQAERKSDHIEHKRC